MIELDPDHIVMPFVAGAGTPLAQQEAVRIHGLSPALLSSATTGGSDNWWTPPEAMDLMQEWYGAFDLDTCAANGESSRCDLYIPPEIDSLTADWAEMAEMGDPNCYNNPPYSKVKAFIIKGYEQSLLGRRVTFLVNAATGTSIWHSHIFKFAAEISFGEGRFSFIAGEDIYNRDGQITVRKGERGAPVKDNAVVHFDRRHVGPPKIRTFKVPKPR